MDVGVAGAVAAGASAAAFATDRAYSLSTLSSVMSDSAHQHQAHQHGARHHDVMSTITGGEILVDVSARRIVVLTHHPI